MTGKSENNPLNTHIILFSALIFSFVYIVNAWVSDDAYITFRTVDNFTHGYGLTWNISERVQTYTHPLWLLVISCFYFFTNEPFYTSLSISFILSMFSILLVVRYANKVHIENKLLRYLLFFVLLISSKSFIDYTSSGLENSLSYFLAILFYAPFLLTNKKSNDFTKRDLLKFLIIASLLFVNRQDTILISFPPLVYLMLKNFRRLKRDLIKIILIGTLPATLWLLFSITYYGFIFPNSAYAKLNTTLANTALLQQGTAYFINSLVWDPITLTIVFFAIGVSLLGKDRINWSICVGIIFYMLYILRIGGCFMSGRFFSVIFFVSCLSLMKAISNKMVLIVMLASTVVIIIINPVSPIKTTRNYQSLEVDKNGIADERGFYFANSGLIFYQRGKTLPYNAMIHKGKKIREASKKVVFRKASTGFYGYAAGPHKHIIDGWAIADPLLARLPSGGRIGHFLRKLPPGYFKTILNNKNQIKSKALHSYYDKLSIIIKGPIFSLERFKTIYLMNTGQFQHLIDSYLFIS